MIKRIKKLIVVAQAHKFLINFQRDKVNTNKVNHHWDSQATLLQS